MPVCWRINFLSDVLDVLAQLKLIVTANFGKIREYQQASRDTDVSDVMSSARFGEFREELCHLNSINVVKIHLLISSDGGSF